MSPQERLEKLKTILKQELTIRKYLKEKKYDQILLEFGSKAYSSHIPYIYKMRELSRLKKSHNYDLILKKYGDKEYNKYISQIMKQDVLQETGNIHLAKKEKTKYVASQIIGKRIISLTGSVLAAATIFAAGLPLLSETLTADMIQENAVKYEKQITTYNENVSNYANEIKELAEANNLTDIDIFMKLMYDMWDSIEGYGAPQIDETGFFRLDIQNGVGVCRHMADDVAYKLNEINPSYNARTLSVNLNTQGTLQIADIDIKFASSATSENIVADTSENRIDTSKLFGNHSVVIVDVNDSTLILDPTNPMIAVLKNGRIELLNPHTGNVGLDQVYFGNSLMSGLDEYEFEVRSLQSYLNPYSISELIEMYGVEAQNTSLQKLQSLQTTISK